MALIVSGIALAVAVRGQPQQGCSTAHIDRCPVQVPNFVGGSANNVGAVLRGEDLIPILTFQTSTGVPKGVVMAQYPIAGSLVKRVTRVTIIVSVGA
jgi:beta-lactam-binding protein with PASTA domain